MGKPSAPPAPDYASAAKATAAGDLAAAQQQTKANRINQVNPYGTLSYSHSGDDPDAGWTQTQTLNPAQQALLDKQQNLSNQYADIAGTGLNKVRSQLEDPNLDTGLPKRAIDVGQTAQQAIMARLRPQIAAREEEQRARLANQGITLGSDAYNKEMMQSGQQRNDLESQAALQGIGLDQQNRSSAISEAAYLKDRPLNLINALRTGSQVQSPHFDSFAQQGQTRGADMMGAANAQYGASMDAYNADAANQQALMNGLFSVGSMAMGMPPGMFSGGKR